MFKYKAVPPKPVQSSVAEEQFDAAQERTLDLPIEPVDPKLDNDGYAELKDSYLELAGHVVGAIRYDGLPVLGHKPPFPQHSLREMFLSGQAYTQRYGHVPAIAAPLFQFEATPYGGHVGGRAMRADETISLIILLSRLHPTGLYMSYTHKGGNIEGIFHCDASLAGHLSLAECHSPAIRALHTDTDMHPYVFGLVRLHLDEETGGTLLRPLSVRGGAACKVAGSIYIKGPLSQRTLEALLRRKIDREALSLAMSDPALLYMLLIGSNLDCAVIPPHKPFVELPTIIHYHSCDPSDFFGRLGRRGVPSSCNLREIMTTGGRQITVLQSSGGTISPASWTVAFVSPRSYILSRRPGGQHSLSLRSDGGTTLQIMVPHVPPTPGPRDVVQMACYFGTPGSPIALGEDAFRSVVSPWTVAVIRRTTGISRAVAPLVDLTLALHPIAEYDVLQRRRAFLGSWYTMVQSACNVPIACAIDEMTRCLQGMAKTETEF